MTWIEEYSKEAALSDQLKDRANHLTLLASGLFGEAGSVLAELKKQQREREAYPYYRHRLLEELGDFLWYFVRIVDRYDPGVLQILSASPEEKPTSIAAADPLLFGSLVGDVLDVIQEPGRPSFREAILRLWDLYARVAAAQKLSLREISYFNLAKTQSRWPVTPEYHQLFDSDCLPEDQLPRTLQIEFIERRKPASKSAQVLLRYRGVNIGARLTDNISEPDEYRYHDIFHIAYAVFLGWSPVTRSLLKCKRKGDPQADENQDGARAMIIEEAVSAIVFSRAKRMNYFDSASQVDYDLLKSIQEFVQGFEVASVPAWQWEKAILEGFKVFRRLRDEPGGLVSWDLEKHRLDWSPIK